MTALYLVLGLALVGGLFYALTQITARQQRLNAELTRLERLSGEVSLNADAILEQVDERIDRLNNLVEQVEVCVAGRLRAAEAAAAPVPEPPVAPAPAQTGPAAKEPRAAKAPKAPKEPKEPRAAKETPSAPTQAPVVAPPSSPIRTEAGVPSIQRYQEARAAVFALADQGKDAGQIAQALSIPRGEVLLILNLRHRKVTA